jgi:hypothetical protein
MSCEVDRASRVNDLAGGQGESGWMRGDDEGNWARGGTDKKVGFEVMDLLNLLPPSYTERKTTRAAWSCTFFVRDVTTFT